MHNQLKINPAANTFIQKQKEASNSLFRQILVPNLTAQVESKATKSMFSGALSLLGARISITSGRRGPRMLPDLPQERLGLPQASVLTPLEDSPGLCFRDFAIDFALVFGQYTTKNLWIPSKNGEHST